MAAGETKTASVQPPRIGDRRVIDEELIKYVADTIVERFHPRRVILFGSQARGDAEPDSDLDVFVEMDTTLRPPERIVAIDSLFRLRSWPMDIVIYTPEESARMRQAKWSLLNTIEAEGKVLYALR